MNGFFVTGTDTEVGKTLMSAALIYAFQEQGLRVCGFKPVVAGMQTVSNSFINEDLETLLTVSNRYRSPNDVLTYDRVCPYQLPTPAAPHLVARQEGIVLDQTVMLGAFNALQAQQDLVIVEGAGGFLVPLSESATLGDFARALDLPVIMVVDIRLGCINHALLTAASITQHQLQLVGWVANCCTPPGLFHQDNIQTLEQMLEHQYQAKLLGVVPFQEEIQTPYSLDNIKKAAGYLSLNPLRTLV